MTVNSLNGDTHKRSFYANLHDDINNNDHFVSNDLSISVVRVCLLAVGVFTELNSLYVTVLVE